MKKYKLLSCLLSLFLVLACGASCQGGNGANCGGCGAVATLKLKDFEDKTINVELGDYFSVASYMLVEDEAGNPYHVSAQIKTADGKAVAHMKYEFKIEDKKGYIVTLTVKRNGAVLAKRVLTLKAIDTSSPVITIGDFPDVCFVGTKYSIPCIIYDANESTTHKVQVYRKGASGAEEEISVVDGGFTPTAAGDYEVRVTANDGVNPEVVKTKTLKVRSVLPVNGLETFEDPSSVENLRNNNEHAASVWLQEFEGRTGVAGQSGSYYDAENNRYYNFNMTFFRTYAELNAYQDEEWDYISIWVYIDQESPVKSYDKTTFEPIMATGEPFTKINNKQEKFNDGEPIYGKQWQELRLSKEMITGNSFFSTNVDGTYVGTVERMNLLMNSGCDDKSKCCLFYSTEFLADTMIYIDDVRYIKTVEVADLQGVAGQEVALSATAENLDCDFVYEVADPEGKPVTVTDGKFTPMMTGEYSVTATIAGAVRAGGSGTGTVIVTSDYSIAAEYTDDSPVKGERIEIPLAQVVDTTGNAVDVDGEITAEVTFNGVAVTLENNGFTATEAGNYKIVYTALANGIKLTKQIEITVLAIAPNLLNGFATEADAANCGWKGIDSTGAIKNEKQWLASYGEGGDVREGVLKLTGSTDSIYRNYYLEADSRWTQASLKTYLDTAEWDYLSVWVWIDVEGEVTVNTIDGTQKVNGGAWVELKMDKAVLTDNTGRVGTTESLSKRLTNSNDYLFYITTAEDTAATNVTVYIDSISLKKNR